MNAGLPNTEPRAEGGREDRRERRARSHRQGSLSSERCQTGHAPSSRLAASAGLAGAGTVFFSFRETSRKLNFLPQAPFSQRF